MRKCNYIPLNQGGIKATIWNTYSNNVFLLQSIQVELETKINDFALKL